jgi:hypothetical protein
VPLRNLHATILHPFGLDPDRLVYPHAGLRREADRRRGARDAAARP